MGTVYVLIHPLGDDGDGTAGSVAEQGGLQGAARAAPVCGTMTVMRTVICGAQRTLTRVRSHPCCGADISESVFFFSLFYIGPLHNWLRKQTAVGSSSRMPVVFHHKWLNSGGEIEAIAFAPGRD